MTELSKVDPAWAWRPYRPGPESPWDLRRAAHLFRRAGCGATLETLQAAVEEDPIVVVRKLVSRNTENTQFRVIADRLARTVVAGGDPRQLSAAWVYRLVRTPSQLLEKMTLFWHGHFATSAEKVSDARMMWAQNELLRTHALGNFSELTHAIAKDPAMLIYLDSATNRKAHPNENFARELMELFCLGEGNYTERDVQELARCFTGWEVKNKKFRKNKYQHDNDEKSCLGEQGDFDGEEAVDIVLAQPSLEMFLARKWYRYFIANEPEPSDELLRPLAESFRNNDLRIAPTLGTLLSSNLFFSQVAIGRRVKSPVELVIGMLRSLEGTTNTQLVARGLEQIGQGLFFPPNVKGWDGGRSWINSSTLLGRSNLIQAILHDESTRFAGKSLSGYFDSKNLQSADDILNHLQLLLMPIAISEVTRTQLKDSFEAATGDHEQRARELLHAVVTLPECQLG